MHTLARMVLPRPLAGWHQVRSHSVCQAPTRASQFARAADVKLSPSANYCKLSRYSLPNQFLRTAGCRFYSDSSFHSNNSSNESSTGSKGSSHWSYDEAGHDTTDHSNQFNWERIFNKKVGAFLAFTCGSVLGGYSKVAWDEGRLPPSITNTETSAQFLPTVHAASGFGKTNADEKIGGGANDGKGPPSVKSQFSFVADVVERLTPSVVNITAHNSRYGPQQMSNGSGVIVDSNGLILTNAHIVINKRGAIIKVRLSDGVEAEAKVVLVDEVKDLAVIKINKSKLPAAPLGDSTALRTGEFVLAIGSPLSLSNSVSAGVVSCPRRDPKEMGLRGGVGEGYIQTDAAITFGNSGGPLVDMDGRVVGINAMKASPGISFAIPIHAARELLERASQQDLSPPRAARPFLGVTMLSLTPDVRSELQNHPLASHRISSRVESGVMVWRVIVNSPAYHAGLSPGDVITSVNGHAVTCSADVLRLVEGGGGLVMRVVRGEDAYHVTVTPES